MENNERSNLKGRGYDPSRSLPIYLTMRAVKRCCP